MQQRGLTRDEIVSRLGGSPWVRRFAAGGLSGGECLAVGVELPEVATVERLRGVRAMDRGL